jgi:hypothetical protein
MTRPTFKQRQDAVDGFANAAHRLALAVAELQRVGAGHLLTDEDGEPLLDMDALREMKLQACRAPISSAQMRGERNDLVQQFTVAALLRIYRQGTGRVEIGAGFADFAADAAGLVGMEIDRRTAIRIAGRIRRRKSNPATDST